MLVAAIFILSGSWRGPAIGGPPPPPPPDGEDISAEGLTVPLDPLQRAGSSSAKVALIEFADFECPYCANYVRTVFPQVRSDLIEKGLVAYAFMHYPLDQIHKKARPAAIASVCAAKQGRFWEMHEVLFQSAGMLPAPATLAGGSFQGFDLAAFNECSRRPDDVVSAQLAEGNRLGIRGTPTLLVGEIRSDGQVDIKRRFVGAASFEAIAVAVKAGGKS